MKPRERVLLPPKGWRKAIPSSVRRLVKVRDGFDADEKGIHIDHRPPLHEREYDPVTNDTIPKANNALFLFAIKPGDHIVRTVGDVKRMAKTQRIRKTEDQHAQTMAEKADGTFRDKKSKRSGPVIKSRGFDKTRTRGFDGKVRARKVRK